MNKKICIVGRVSHDAIVSAIAMMVSGEIYNAITVYDNDILSKVIREKNFTDSVISINEEISKLKKGDSLIVELNRRVD